MIRYRVFSTNLFDTNIAPDELLVSFTEFCDYYNGLNTTLNGSKTFSDRQLSDQIFKEYPKKNELQEVMQKHCFVSNGTLQRYKAIVTDQNILGYRGVFQQFVADVYGICQFIEIEIRKNTFDFFMANRDVQSGWEIHQAASTILNIGALNNLSQFYLREIIPLSAFMLRQTIEVTGRRMLGFHDVSNAQGGPAKLSGKVIWHFVKSEMASSNPRINLPMDIEIILKIEAWTNSYIHSGTIPRVYLIENAIRMLHPLFSNSHGVHDYRNATVSPLVGSIVIKNYNAVKFDFEAFLNSERKTSLFGFLKVLIRIVSTKFMRQKKKYAVHWLPMNNVDATIQSL